MSRPAGEGDGFRGIPVVRRNCATGMESLVGLLADSCVVWGSRAKLRR